MNKIVSIISLAENRLRDEHTEADRLHWLRMKQHHQMAEERFWAEYELKQQEQTK